MPTLHLLSPVSLPKIGHGLRFETKTLTIGSRLPADLVLREPSVSPLHARLTEQAGGYLLEDLGSDNGVYVGQCRTQRIQIGYRQMFRIGRVAVMLLADEVTPNTVPRSEQVKLEALASPTGKPSAEHAVRLGARKLRLPTLAPSVVLATAAVTAALACSLFFAVRGARPKPGTYAPAARAETRLLELSPVDEARRVQITPRFSFLVPSAAVTARTGVSVTVVERPRAPGTSLLSVEGPGAWLDFAAEEPPIRGIIAEFSPEARKPMSPIWGQYLARGKRWNYAPRATPLTLSESSLVVPLKLSPGAVLRGAGRFRFIFDEARSPSPDTLEALHVSLERTWEQLVTAGSRLPSTPILVLLSATTTKRHEPRCQSHVTLGGTLEAVPQSVLEKALLALACGHNV